MAFAFQNISHSLKFDEICFLYETINDGRHDSQSANCGPKSKKAFLQRVFGVWWRLLRRFPSGEVLYCIIYGKTKYQSFTLQISLQWCRREDEFRLLLANFVTDFCNAQMGICANR